MCLIVFAYQTIPGYRLILAANRDEFYDRPSLPAGFREDNPDILSGTDLVAGGTWLGMNIRGRFAALTNYRDINSHNPEAKSRGHLIKDYLEYPLNASKYVENIQNATGYNGFNLIAGDRKEFYHFSNQTMKATKIEPGIHGISNALLNTPWPKVEESKKNLRNLIEKRDLSEMNLFKLLLSTKTYPEDSLPRTGLSPAMEKSVSSIFIKTSDYGTRCSSYPYNKR